MTPKKIFRFFQARTAKGSLCVAVRGLSDALGAVTQVKGSRHIQVALPYGERAMDRTVRLHEADHLNYQSPERAKWIKELREKFSAAGHSEVTMRLIRNGIEDRYIGSIPAWRDRPLSVKRDAAAVAIRELRRAYRDYKRLEPAFSSYSIDFRNTMQAQWINATLRCAALIRWTVLRKRPAWIYDEFDMAVIRSGTVQQLTDWALSMLESPNPPMPTETITEGEIEESDYNGDGIKNVGKNNPAGAVVIHPLRNEPCEPLGMDHPSEEHSQNGYRIARRALTSIACGIPVFKPFIRQLQPHLLSGVVLIDASGSMHASEDKLRKLCELAPGSTVIYYSSPDDGDGVKTHCVYFAKDGMRMGKNVSLCNHYDGNGDDLAALRLAMHEHQQMGCTEPMTVITDCGWGNVQTEKVFQELKQAGKVRHIYSIPEALKAFAKQS
jgi:hypothetical protein